MDSGTPQRREEEGERDTPERQAGGFSEDELDIPAAKRRRCTGAKAGASTPGRTGAPEEDAGATLARPSDREVDVDSLKVVELKEELQRRGLNRTGLKAELAQRLRDAIAKQVRRRPSAPRQVHGTHHHISAQANYAASGDTIAAVHADAPRETAPKSSPNPSTAAEMAISELECSITFERIRDPVMTPGNMILYERNVSVVGLCAMAIPLACVPRRLVRCRRKSSRTLTRTHAP